jgi:putative sigma-54 modulation protein
MKYISTYKNVKSSKALDEGIKQTFEKLEKYFDTDYTCYAVISHKGKTPNNACVEITIKTDKCTYRAETITDDFYKSTGDNLDKIKRQIKKHKTKILSKKRNKTDINTTNSNTVEEPCFENELIRRKRFEILPMSIDEAMLQLDMLDHDFFIFANEETDEVNLIYKRKDGGYGIIEVIN